MYPQDVVWNASRREVPPNMSKERFLAGFAKFLKDTNSKLLQIGNTVLVLKSIGPGQAEIDLYTVEPINVLPARFKAGAKAAKEMGYKHIVAFVDSDALMQMVPKLGLNLKVSQGTKVIQGQPVQMPRVDVTL